jgi:hypothetical protein
MASANYVVTPKNGAYVQISTANALRDGTGTLGTVFTAASSSAGSRIDRIAIVATGTTTAGMIRLFVANSAGSSIRLIREIPVIAITPSATQPSFALDLSFDNGLILENGASLRASTNNAESFNIQPIVAGDFV